MDHDLNAAAISAEAAEAQANLVGVGLLGAIFDMRQDTAENARATMIERRILRIEAVLRAISHEAEIMLSPDGGVAH